MTAGNPVEIALAFVRKINEHDLEGLADLMSEEHVFVDTLGARVEGRQKMRQAWIGYFRLFPDYYISCAEVFQEGAVIALFGTAGATGWEIPAAWKAVIRDGRVAEWRVYADNEPARRILAASAAPNASAGKAP